MDRELAQRLKAAGWDQNIYLTLESKDFFGRGAILAYPSLAQLLDALPPGWALVDYRACAIDDGHLPAFRVQLPGDDWPVPEIAGASMCEAVAEAWIAIHGAKDV